MFYPQLGSDRYRSQLSKNCFLCRHQRKSAQWPGYSTPPSLTFPSTPKFQACSTRFSQDTIYLANNEFSMATKPDLAIYYHRATFCPVPSNFIAAINKGKISTWPGLTAELISKHLPKILATAKGHAKLDWKNVRSTRPPAPTPDPTPDLSVTSDPPPTPDTRTKTIHITAIKPSDLLVTDLTGRFPTISRRGYNDIIVCYIYDTNGIILRPMKKYSGSEHIQVHQDIFSYLEKRGLHSDVHKKDNECPQALKEIIVYKHKTK